MAELRFDGKTAIVTGAGGNPSLGRAHAMLLAARGANVVVNDIGSDPESKGYKGTASAEAVVQEIRAAGGKAVADTNSVATEEGAGALIKTAIDAFGSVDILVNNAGICESAAFDELSSRDFTRHIQINLMGPVWTCRAAWPHMKRKGYGRIVNIGSGAMIGLAGLVAYATSKGGLFALTRSISVEGAAFGIKANVIHPAAHTRMLEAQQEEDSSLLVAARAGQPAELVSPAVAYLAHESCPVTGECISSIAGFVNRLYLAETKGVMIPNITIEDLRDRWDEVVSENGAATVNAGFIDTSQWRPKPYKG
ncbi:MAG TPA: SDR family NAD(P)-dependent oxidoreductase [Caulobacterales bacterium]|nr:SDR family NAD(P)-dependent oxidoreductase [Caulobacterales bacterium]